MHMSAGCHRLVCTVDAVCIKAMLSYFLVL